ncbi:MAG: tRNA (adenosine(37)-N6)-threonylcarbamoyltransferase complex dimerization subunit type 1 TsaB [Alphaproteobacteria bacterium]
MGDGQGHILAIDTAMNACSVACYNAESGNIRVRSVPMPRGQAESLVPMVQEVVDEAGLAFEALGVVVTTTGPGAFTGLRVGLSAAKSFALALDVPLWGVSTFQVLALAYIKKYPETEGFTVLIETKREDFYIQSFDAKGSALSEPLSMRAEDIAAGHPAGSIFIGDAVARFKGMLKHDIFKYVEGFDFPDPSVMVKAFTDPKMREAFFAKGVSPLYLRAPDVSFPKVSARIVES